MKLARVSASVTLMAIMVAGGLTFAVPASEPAYAINPNLFISAENPEFGNYMGGPQVIEVVISDTDIDETGESKGDPDVTLNGERLVTVQATDGKWYAYFADRMMAERADVAGEAGVGLDFGEICSANAAVALTGLAFESDAVAFPADIGCPAIDIVLETADIDGITPAELAAALNELAVSYDGIAQISSSSQLLFTGFGPVPGLTEQMGELTELVNTHITDEPDATVDSTIAVIDDFSQGLPPASAAARAVTTVLVRDLGGMVDDTDDILDLFRDIDNAYESLPELIESRTAHVQLQSDLLAAAAAGASGNQESVKSAAEAAAEAIANDAKGKAEANPPEVAPTTMNVVREAKEPNTSRSEVGFGQHKAGNITSFVKAPSNVWPFIQLYDLSQGGNVKISYDRGGGVQTTFLTFDTVSEYASLGLDRTEYPDSAQVHFVIKDTWLNIDPTDEDSWTWDVEDINGDDNVGNVYYQAFDENGGFNGVPGVGIVDFLGVVPNAVQEGFDGNTVKALLDHFGQDFIDRVEDGFDFVHKAELAGALDGLMCEDNCRLILDRDVDGQNIVEFAGNTDSNVSLSADKDAATDGLVSVIESEANSGTFNSFDEQDDSVLVTIADPRRDTTATIDYNETPQSIVIGHAFATIDMQPPGDVWLPGTEIPVVLVDPDANKNSRADEDLTLSNSNVEIIPALKIGAPITLADASAIAIDSTSESANDSNILGTDAKVDDFSDRLVLFPNEEASATIGDADRFLVINHTATVLESRTPAITATNTLSEAMVTVLLHYDVSALATEGNTLEKIILRPGDHATEYTDQDPSGIIELDNEAIKDLRNAGGHSLAFEFSNKLDPELYAGAPVVADFFRFGIGDDGTRYNDAIFRLELEEDGDDTGRFVGSLEYSMVSQLSAPDPGTYTGLSFVSDEVTFVAHEDLTDEDAPRVNYLDFGADGVATQISDQQAAPSHSGTVSLDSSSYKIADTVTVTVNDPDLNADSDRVDVYTIPSQATGEPRLEGHDQVGRVGGLDDTIAKLTTEVNRVGLPLNGGEFSDFAPAIDAETGLVTITLGSAENVPYDIYQREIDDERLGRMLDITFDDMTWERGACGELPDAGLAATGFTLRETGSATGVFTGDFQIPSKWCEIREGEDDEVRSTTGTDIEVNYVDFRDASGETVEVGAGAGVRANTGSVSFDRQVYPVPFGDSDSGAPFATHETHDGYLAEGVLHVHVRVTDPDYDVSASGEDTLKESVDRDPNSETDIEFGPLAISVRRGADSVLLAYAGGTERAGTNTIITDLDNVNNARDLGPLIETAPDSGTFELDMEIAFNHGPASTHCPDDGVGTPFADVDADADENFCILQGDILQVEYTDVADASGEPQTVTDSATFDLRNAVLRTDKSVYIIGSDMIVTLIEPDLDLDNDSAETYTLGLVEWESDAADTVLLDAAFDPEPRSFRETGDSTGIFQTVIEIPSELADYGTSNTEAVERGEQITLEYQDKGPAGANYVGEEDEDIDVVVHTSDYGATIELDQAVYSWTDKVFITIIAPDHNFDSNLVDRIGDGDDDDPLHISTREGGRLSNYRLVETGTDTGIFTGEVILTGFEHDADGDASTGDDNGNDALGDTRGADQGPTGGFIAADYDDGITVSYEFNDDETVVGSALVRWNVGDVQWLESSYPATGTGIVRIVDPDMNLDPEAVDNFEVDAFSDNDSSGISLTVTETQASSGIFEGTVLFTTTDESSGHRLRIAEGDTITAKYDDNTLPEPYQRNDELRISGTAVIGTLVPPLERAVITGLAITDNAGNALDQPAAGQQLQITGQIASGQDDSQDYAYLVQVNDASGVTLHLTWREATLNAGQTVSESVSWQPSEPGQYTATAFVWESTANPTALSPQFELPFTVS